MCMNSIFSKLSVVTSRLYQINITPSILEKTKILYVSKTFLNEKYESLFCDFFKISGKNLFN